MPWPVMLKKLKLNGSMKTFWTNTKKRCPVHHKGLECKSRKSKDTWSNRQVWPWSTRWSRAKANRVLTREHTGHSKHPLPSIQDTWTSTDCQYRNQIGYILCIWRWSSSIQSAKQDWGDGGSDCKLLTAKFRLKLKKVWPKSTLWIYH